MAVIDIRDFGGLVPKASARALPNDAAQTAQNISAVTREFRPLAADDTVIANTSVSAPLSLYRFPLNSDGSVNSAFSTLAKWIVAAKDRSYVPSQLNDDVTCRTYYTVDDGTAAPRVIDNGGGDRQLGVPAPTTAPTIVVNEVDQFTTEDRTNALKAALKVALDAVRSNVAAAWVGATHPGTGTTGYLDQTAGNNFAIPDDARMVRAYRLTGSGGTVSDAYSTVDDTLFSWVFDPALRGYQGQAGATPSWAGGAGMWHQLLSFHAYGLTFTLNTAAIDTALTAIEMPGMDDGTKLFTSDQIDDIVATLDAVVDPDGPVLKPRIDALSAAVAALKALLDGGPQASLAATTDAFYDKADVAAAIAAAKVNFAESVFNMADLVARSSLPADYTGAGAAPSGDY